MTRLLRRVCPFKVISLSTVSWLITSPYVEESPVQSSLFMLLGLTNLGARHGHIPVGYYDDVETIGHKTMDIVKMIGNLPRLPLVGNDRSRSKKKRKARKHSLKGTK